VTCACLNTVFFESRCEIHVLCLIFLQILFSQAVVGCIVLTDYNNETYRVDDVNFDVCPKSTFQITRRGSVSNVSYVDYYLKVSCVFWIGLVWIFALNLVQPLNPNVSTDVQSYFSFKCPCLHLRGTVFSLSAFQLH
jgi:hypothetical protein